MKDSEIKYKQYEKKDFLWMWRILEMNNNAAVLSKIYKILSAYPDADQRFLAEKLELSLGSINSILRTFCKKGLVNVTPINLKKDRYEISDAGIMEIMDYHKKCVVEAREFVRGQGLSVETVGLVG